MAPMGLIVQDPSMQRDAVALLTPPAPPSRCCCSRASSATLITRTTSPRRTSSPAAFCARHQVLQLCVMRLLGGNEALNVGPRVVGYIWAIPQCPPPLRVWATAQANPCSGMRLLAPPLRICPSTSPLLPAKVSLNPYAPGAVWGAVLVAPGRLRVAATLRR
jgi:hypothetical protein